MSEGKHTPGPWKVWEGIACCTVDHAEWGATIAEVGENDERGMADAALIAAAPEMLEALKEIRADCDARAIDGVVPIGRSAWVALENAIAKAEGRE